LFLVAAYWSAGQYSPIRSVLPAVLGTTLIVIGAQNLLGGFLLAIVNGNEAEFGKTETETPARPETAREPELRHAGLR
jgi:hypothetical protein